MNKTHKGKYFTLGFIVAVFCFSFLFINTATITKSSANSQSILKTKAEVSTVQSSSVLTGNDWPMFRGNLNNTGFTDTTPIRGTNPHLEQIV